jgi:hypothetical protein
MVPMARDYEARLMARLSDRERELVASALQLLEVAVLKAEPATSLREA